MTHTTELETEWARSQIEAYVDGRLDGDDAERMRAAVAADAGLSAAVERARGLRRMLQTLPEPAAPRALLWRLLGIPRARRTPLLVVAAPLAAAALALGVALWIAVPEPVPDERAAALRDFRVAMNYLRKTAEVTRDEVNGAVVLGISEALTVGRDVVLDEESQNGD